MINECIARAQAWFGRTVRNSAVQHFSKSVHAESLKRAVPCVSTFVVGACVLLGQLTLSAAGWPESFAAFTLASPLLSVAILAGLAGVAYPPCAHRLPLYGLVAFVALGALQALLGAAVHITPSPPNRVQFALLTAGVVCIAVMVLSKKVMGDALETLESAGDRARRQFRSAVQTPLQGDAEDSDSEDVAGDDART